MSWAKQAVVAGVLVVMTSLGATAEASLAPLEDTFSLHSQPGASRTIYLDFDGHALSDSAWEGYVGSDVIAPPFDTDGNPGSFSEAERLVIQEVWARVAEDFAPFAVDVTTQDPGRDALLRSDSSDAVYGMRVLFSPISDLAEGFSSVSGLAYLGAFDAIGDHCQPALVFPEKLANAARNMAECASHQLGHTFSLNHDGTSIYEYYPGGGSGETGWVPIMGYGTDKNLTQWSRGEYADASNTQDDIAVIIAHGAPLRTDDHGDTKETATVLVGSGELDSGGVIRSETDVDFFAITSGAGLLAVEADPAEVGANLDILLELTDASGAVLASANPVELLAASIEATVSQGTYYLSVRGTGKGEPASADGYSAYGSLGTYTIAASVPVIPATRYRDNDPMITYTPAWSRWDDSGYWAACEDTYAFTDKARGKVIVTFEGTSLSWISRTANTQGKAKVTLYEGDPSPDNLVKEETVDLYTSTTQWKKSVYSTGPLGYGVHTVVIECLGTKNPASWWYTTGVDAFDITGTLVQSPTITNVDDKSASYFAYAPDWSHWDDSGYWAAYSDTYAFTETDGDKVTFTFHGTYASWVAATSNTKGKALVTLDPGTSDEKTTPVDLYSPTTLWKQNVYDTGLLSDGAHTIEIECLREKNWASYYFTVDVDRFDIIETIP